MKRLRGLFLEMIFLVFILGYGPAPTVTPDEDSGTTISASSMALVEPICRVNHDYSPDSNFSLKHYVPDLLVPAISFDLPAARILNGKAFFFSLFERNVFYVFTTIHAP